MAQALRTLGPPVLRLALDITELVVGAEGLSVRPYRGEDDPGTSVLLFVPPVTTRYWIGRSSLSCQRCTARFPHSRSRTTTTAKSFGTAPAPELPAGCEGYTC